MSKKELTKEGITEILNLICQAKENAGQKVAMATMHEGEETTILLDNRDKESIN